MKIPWILIKFWSNFDDFNFYKFEERRKLYVYGFGSAYEG